MAGMGFSLRGIDGSVAITYGVNDDPERWGFQYFGWDWDIEVARGFPVIEARVRYPAEGYAAILGWIQVVAMVDRDDPAAETTWIVPDVAPQYREANTPYLAFGIEPVMFDTPATDAPNVEFRASTFLTYTPDCLLTPVVEPLCGFTWGYDIEQGVVRPKQLRGSTVEDWLEARKLLRIRLPTWTFGGDDWQPPALAD
ncbi:MAG TPA: hypothetical protein VFX16_22860 [Pseudonocardiaceae bacterium]|nr:hypothetical protein [Pseudonocardiaceae bacterium]